MAFNKYPYTDFSDYNLDWIIHEIKELHKEWSDFEILNTIRFEGVWNITKQYPAWSLVTDDNVGYISIQPVPAGIDISEYDYWREVYNYSTIIPDIMNRIIALEGDVLNIDTVEIPAITDDVTDLDDRVDDLESAVTTLENNITHLIEGGNDYPDGTKFYMISGTIRQDALDYSWKYINDSGHKPLGVSGAAATTPSADTIRINFDQTYDKVVSFVCGPDEWFADKAVTVGASVGASYADLRLTSSQTIGGQVYYTSGTGWQYSANVSSVSYASNTLTVNLNTTVIGSVSQLSISPMISGQTLTNIYTPAKRFPSEPGIMTPTSFQVRFIKPDGSYYNGTANVGMSLDFAYGGTRQLTVNGSDSRSYSDGNIWFIGIMAKLPTP